ncbi:putative DNA double-strand break repair Rad50 ATPase [Achromobacter veterisilvae]|uniref:Putative DNA double-strand break repair Rad50 ATPase n=1 Tax=Achromobacter veterisilvae TaxID=2069367 RepID=A0A446CH93_9BURK|nr:AAA family ATPase [Achromobacter veterisilvae]SSW67232.1 putative DNA double-strand break repair Rad50 ATPase [Achromobacter veterisilvae]
MRINRITIENFQGARAVDLDLRTPAALIAGANGAGKSSIAEAVRLALLGTPERVGLKKEFGALVTEGAKVGAVALDLDDGTVGIGLPKGTQSGEVLVPQSPALPYVLAPERFAAAKPDERRTLLFALSGTNVKADEIERRLLDRGCSPLLVPSIKPILRSGFAAGAEYAKQQATEAKGAWKAVAGEQWGSQKAEGWAAEIPPFDQAALVGERATLAGVDAKLEQNVKAQGALEQKASAYAAARDLVAARQTQAAKLPALRQKLEFDRAEHANLAERVSALEAKAGTGPRVGLVHALADSLAEAFDTLADEHFSVDLHGRSLVALTEYERQFGKIGAVGDAEASAALPKAIEARDLMARSVENDLRDISAAEVAAVQLQDETAPEEIRPADVEAARAKVTALRAERKAVDDRVQALLNAKQAATSAAERTANATRYHADVLAWLAIGDALSPDGIPGEILAEALQPFNAKLADLAELAGWLTPAIAADMGITWGGRSYRLLSESERWRVDALIGAALAEISGLRCLILDRFDVLDLPGRGDALGLVDALSADGRMDTILVLGTLKAAPPAPSDAFTVHWLEQGHAGPAKLKEAA